MLKKNITTSYVCAGVLLASPINYAAAKHSVQAESGIYGTSIQHGFRAEDGVFAVFEYDIVIKDAKTKKVVQKVRTKQKGKFTVTLPPGKYIIVPLPGRNGSEVGIAFGNYKKSIFASNQAKVTVWKGYRTMVDVTFCY